MLRDVLKFESEFKYARAINVVVDKKNKPEDFDVFSAAWKKLINRFETTVLFKNYPSPWNVDLPNEKGFLIVDETDEEKLRGLVRKMRTSNILPSSPFGGTANYKLRSVVEDPMHKKSKLSGPIQLCDINANFLMQTLKPNSTIKKHKAQNWFYLLEPILLKVATKNDPHGIVRY